MEREENGYQDKKETSPVRSRFTRQAPINAVKPERSESAKESEPDIPILLNPPEGNFTARQFSARVRIKIREIMESESDSFDSPLIYNQLKETIQKTVAELKAETKKADEWLRFELRDYLDSGTDFTARKWTAKANLKGRNKHFLRIMSLITKAQIAYQNSQRYGKMEIDGKMEWPVLTRMRNDGHPLVEDIANEMGISQSQVWKHIKAAEEMGFLMRFGGTKYRGDGFFVTGIHNWYKDKKTGEKKRRPLYFLKGERLTDLRTLRRPD